MRDSCLALTAGLGPPRQARHLPLFSADNELEPVYSCGSSATAAAPRFEGRGLFGAVT